MNAMLGIEEDHGTHMRMVVKVAGALLDDASAMESLARQVRSSPTRATKF